jgi:hypothetical protein
LIGSFSRHYEILTHAADPLAGKNPLAQFGEISSAPGSGPDSRACGVAEAVEAGTVAIDGDELRLPRSVAAGGP